MILNSKLSSYLPTTTGIQGDSKETHNEIASFLNLKESETMLFAKKKNGTGEHHVKQNKLTQKVKYYMFSSHNVEIRGREKQRYILNVKGRLLV